MSATLTSTRLELVPATPGQLLAKWQAPDGTFPPEVSPAWTEQLRAARAPDPWVLGYLAYGVDEPFRGQGYATEIAAALVAFAFADARVRRVCAHTLQGATASASILAKCGFARVPDVVDPEDGLVWRFERGR
jgi:hypothetical protein